MSVLAYIIVFSLIGSVFSLLGGVILLVKKKWADSIQHFFLAFAAGALLATAFFDLLPEAQEAAGGGSVFGWTLFGIMTFFLIENLISWFHYHPEKSQPKVKPVAALIVLGDTIHNFLDGLAIGATFLIDIHLGIITTLAVAAHEIPQEIGDFAILLSAGYSRTKTLLVNFLSAVATIVAALAVYFFGQSFDGLVPIALPVTAGFFIYIALSDLVPEIHHGHKRSYILLQAVILFAGLGLVWFAVRSLE